MVPKCANRKYLPNQYIPDARTKFWPYHLNVAAEMNSLQTRQSLVHFWSACFNWTLQLQLTAVAFVLILQVFPICLMALQLPLSFQTCLHQQDTFIHTTSAPWIFTLFWTAKRCSCAKIAVDWKVLNTINQYWNPIYCQCWKITSCEFYSIQCDEPLQMYFFFTLVALMPKIKWNESSSRVITLNRLLCFCTRE